MQQKNLGFYAKMQEELPRLLIYCYLRLHHVCQVYVPFLYVSFLFLKNTFIIHDLIWHIRKLY